MDELAVDPEAHFDEAGPDGRACRVSLPRFFVSRYPVTVGQWKMFREDVRWRRWVPKRPDGSVIAEDDFDPSAEQAPNGSPVAFVDWYQALAYCDWLTAWLRQRSETREPLATLLTLLREGDDTSGGLPWVLTLPSEAEWERVARGDADMRRWPWDGQRGVDLTLANGGRTNVEWWEDPDAFDPDAPLERNVVGAYPTGASSCGSADTAGNVWEWTRSMYVESYPYHPDYAGVGRERLTDATQPRRVARGGAFDDLFPSLRCACRYHFHPDGRYDPSGRVRFRRRSLGFRVFASPFRGATSV